jgi:RNA 3'-terminal phosphate cyclase (ATP)
MGPRVQLAVERPGFAPAGGGRMIVTIEPAKALRPSNCSSAGRCCGRQARRSSPACRRRSPSAS